VAETNGSPTINLGFLTVLNEPSGQLGGYLVTNSWGRPLEFRLSTAVQPNRVQQILYASTLQSYICADLIGKTLVDKTATPVQLIVTDRDAVLELRRRLEVPIVWLASGEETSGMNFARAEAEIRPAEGNRPALWGHPGFAGDREAVRGLLEKLDQGLDLSEPFGRIREAINEARKMGVTSRN